MTASEFLRKPQYEKSDREHRNLPERQRNEHQECRKTHLAPAVVIREREAKSLPFSLTKTKGFCGTKTTSARSPDHNTDLGPRND